MRLLCAVLSCVFALGYATVLNRPGGDAGCPAGARCAPLDQCPGAAHADGLRGQACDSAARELRVCCWDTALAALAPPFQRQRRAVSAAPPSPTPLPSPPASSVRPPSSSQPSPAPTPASKPATSATRPPKPAPKPTITPAPTPPAPVSKPSVTPTPLTPTNTTLSGNGKPKNVSSSARACEEFRQFDGRLASSSLSLWRRKKRNERVNVVGGERATNAEFIYIVAIGYVRGKNNATTSDLQWGCGGSLVSNRYVLTAAHCITDAQRQDMRPAALRMGVHHLAAGAQRPGDYSVASVTLHPRHRPELNYFDLALLRTDREVRFSSRVLPVCLAAPDTRVDATTALLVAGWGAVDPAGFEPSADLKKALLRFVDLEECKKFITTTKNLPRGLESGMMCAAEPNRQADTCRGDSGGPLVVRGPQGDVLVGVTSFGGRPCSGSKPGVYARVLSELAWIESVVWS